MIKVVDDDGKYEYECNNCGEKFSEPDSYEECVGEYWGAPAYQTFACCPYCGSDDITDYDDYDEEDEDDEEDDDDEW